MYFCVGILQVFFFLYFFRNSFYKYPQKLVLRSLDPHHYSNLKKKDRLFELERSLYHTKSSSKTYILAPVCNPPNSHFPFINTAGQSRQAVFFLQFFDITNLFQQRSNIITSFLISITRLPSAESTEIFSCNRNNIRSELHGNTTKLITISCQVKIYPELSLKLVFYQCQIFQRQSLERFIFRVKSSDSIFFLLGLFPIVN